MPACVMHGYEQQHSQDLTTGQAWDNVGWHTCACVSEKQIINYNVIEPIWLSGVPQGSTSVFYVLYYCGESF